MQHRKTYREYILERFIEQGNKRTLSTQNFRENKFLALIIYEVIITQYNLHFKKAKNVVISFYLDM